MLVVVLMRALLIENFREKNFSKIHDMKSAKVKADHHLKLCVRSMDSTLSMTSRLEYPKEQSG